MRKNLRSIIAVRRGVVSLPGFVIIAITFCLAGNAYPVNSIQALSSSKKTEYGDAIEVVFEQAQYNELKSVRDKITFDFPVSVNKNISLDLKPFNIFTPHARFLTGSVGGDGEFSKPDIVMFRGEISGQPHSRAYLAFGSDGSAGGFVSDEAGETWFLAQNPPDPGDTPEKTLYIHKAGMAATISDMEWICQTNYPQEKLTGERFLGYYADTAAGLRVSECVIEGDYTFTKIFPDVNAAANYVAILMGAVSDIFERDLNMRLMISFLRFWPDGGEPFDLSVFWGFELYWSSHAGELDFDINVGYLFHSRQDLAWGIGSLGGTCGNGAFAVAYLRGHLPLPVGVPNAANMDLSVVAHEIGHGFHGYHTHDPMFPDTAIDHCYGDTIIFSRGTIMSYCEAGPGYTSNYDLRFHRLIQEWMEWDILSHGCYWFDCNDNGDDDSRDILLGISSDVNDNGIPDECEDCNTNGILDNYDIAAGSPDINSNGIPDECEDDCNDNNIPDEWETRELLSPDANGNCVPDECDPDCDGNGNPDFTDIKDGILEDWDNNNIPDICQDCDENGVADIIDLEKEFNLYVVDENSFVREYDATNGYPLQNLAEDKLSGPSYCAFGPDRQLYITCLTGIMRLDVENDSVSTFIPINSDGLNAPTFLTFGPDGNLYISNLSTHEILRFNGATGEFMDVFVSSGSGGLVAPYGLEFSASGNLFVASGNSKILEYDGSDGSFIGEFVSQGSGGLSSPRGIAFAPDGHLLVASHASGQILLYDGVSGEFMRQFSDTGYFQITPWCIRVTPWGNVIVPHESFYPFVDMEIYEYFYPSGKHFRRFVNNDAGLIDPVSVAFRPKSANDIDGNYILDECDLCIDSDGDGYGDPDQIENTCRADNCPEIYNPQQMDSDYDGIGDACDDCLYDRYNDQDDDGICGDEDNCPTISNAAQIDSDGDGVGDDCDNCINLPNSKQDDADKDFLGDACDNCPEDINPDQADADSDNVGNICDNCPSEINPLQEDIDDDGFGDICDNCPEDYNPSQVDICSYMCGDANNDETINILDITFLIAYLYKDGATPESLWASDPNGDGTANILDITYLIAFLYKDGAEPTCQLQ